MTRILKATLILSISLTLICAGLSTTYAIQAGMDSIYLELKLGETSKPVKAQKTTYFRFIAPETDVYYVRFNDGVELTKVEAIDSEHNLNCSSTTYDSKTKEYSFSLMKGDECILKAYPYPLGGSTPVCDTLTATVRARGDAEDGIVRERAIAAKPGTKTKVAESTSAFPEIWIKAHLEAGNEYSIKLYRGTNFISPSDEDNLHAFVAWPADLEEFEYDDAILGEFDYKSPSTDKDDEQFVVVPETGDYYIKADVGHPMGKIALLVDKKTYPVDGKIENKLSLKAGDVVKTLSATAVNKTSASITMNIDLYDTDGTTVIAASGEPLESGSAHTASTTVKSGVRGVLNNEAFTFAEYMGCTISSDKKSITYKYKRLSGLVVREKHNPRDICDDLDSKEFINATDEEAEVRLVLYEDSEHTSVAGDNGEYSYKFSIPANTSVRLYEVWEDNESGGGSLQETINKLKERIVYQGDDYDESTNTWTEYYHTLACELSPDERAQIKEFVDQNNQLVDAIEKDIKDEVHFKYVNPAKAGIKNYEERDVLSYLSATRFMLPEGNFEGGRSMEVGEMKVQARFATFGFFCDEECTRSAYWYNDWINNGVLYARVGYSCGASYYCGSGMGDYPVDMPELSNPKTIIIKITLERVDDISKAAVKQINANKSRLPEYKGGMSDLRGLNTAFSAHSNQVVNVKSFLGEEGNDFHEKLVGDTGLRLQAYVQSVYDIGSNGDYVRIRNYGTVFGTSTTYGYYYMLGDVFYGDSKPYVEFDNETIAVNSINTIAVDKTATDTTEALKDRITNYFGNKKKVSVTALSPSELANMLDAYSIDDDGNVNPIKAVYLTKHGFSFYTSDTDTSKSKFIETIPFTKSGLSTMDFSGIKSIASLKYMKYDNFAYGEYEDTYECTGLAAYPVYRVKITDNTHDYDALYFAVGASADKIKQLDREALAYDKDSSSNVAIAGVDGNIPVDTSVKVQEQDAEHFTAANEDLEGKDVSVYDVETFSSSQGKMSDFGENEVNVMLPVGDDTVADVYCFEENGKITSEQFDVEYQDIDGQDYAVFKTNHFSLYGTAETVCEHVLSRVDKVPATFGKAGTGEYYECSKCGRLYKDENASTRVRSDELIIPAAEAALSKTSYVYNGKVHTPSIKTNELVKGNDYKVTLPSGRKLVGTYKIKLAGIGDYTGTKYLSYKIVPKGTTISKLTRGKKSFTVKIKKPSGSYLKQTTGYQIRYSTSSKMTKAKTVTISKSRTVSKKISKLKAKKKYYVQVRTYKTVKGKKYYSSWSSKKAVVTR